MLTHIFTESVVPAVSGPRVLVSHPRCSSRHELNNTAITFVSSDADSEVLQKIQERFTVAIPTLPDTVDPATYSAYDHSAETSRAKRVVTS